MTVDIEAMPKQKKAKPKSETDPDTKMKRLLAWLQKHGVEAGEALAYVGEVPDVSAALSEVCKQLKDGFLTTEDIRHPKEEEAVTETVAPVDQAGDEEDMIEL